MKNLLLRLVLPTLILLITNLFFTGNASAQTTYYSRATGNWTTNTTWSLSSGGAAVGAGIYPVSGDIVNIERGFNVTIPASTGVACATLNITSVNVGNGTLTFSAASSLVVSGNIKVGTAGAAKAGVITMTAGGTITCNGNLTLGADAASNITQGAAATVTVNGTAMILQPGINNITNAWNVNAGTATVSGLFTLDGINATASRKSNLVITTGTFNANGGIQVNGTTAATKTINMTGTTSVLNIGGAGISGASGATFTRGSVNSIVQYNAAGNQANIGNYTYFNLKTSGSGTKTILGNTTVSGTLTVTAGTALNLSTFTMNPVATVLECGAATGSSVTGTGSLILSGNLTVNDAVGAGTSAATISTPVALNGNRIFTVSDDGSAAADLVINGAISGANTLTKAGVGTMEFGAGNTYSSTTTINAGTLQYAVSNAIGNGGITVSGGTLDIKTFSDAVGAVTLTSGTITGTTGVLSGTAYAVASGTISAIIGGAGSLTKTTAATVTLSAANTYTGSTTISAGTLSINSIANFGTASSLGTGSVTPTISMGATGILLYTGTGHSSSRVINLTASGATINASGTGSLILSGGVTATNRNLILTGTGNAIESGAIATGNGTITKNGAGTWQFSAGNTFTGLTTINAGTIQYGIGNAFASGGITVNGGILNVGSFSDAVGAVTLISGAINGTTGVLSGSSYAMRSGTVSAILGGAGALTKTTAGTVTLSGTNTYTGRTTISAGILSVTTIADGGTAGNIGAATNAAANLVLAGGTLQYNGATASSNRNYTLTAGTTSVIEITANTLTLAGASTNTTGALTKTGSGTLLLSGNNLYTGATTITAGTLKLGAAERISNTSALFVNATFDMNGFSETVASLSGSGTITSSTAGTILLTVGNATSTTFSGIIQNGSATSVALTKLGTGALTLSGNNTFSGKITITAGSIVLGASNVLPNNQVVLGGGSLRTGATTGFTETIGDLVVSTNSSITLGTGVHTVTVANSSANTWAATTLTINGWTGTGGINNTATQGKIMIGVGGLSAAQLTKITFAGFSPGAAITASGELIPFINAYYSTGSVAPNVLTNWKTARDGSGTSPANFTSGSIFVIQGTHTMTTTATWAVSGTSSKVWVENGGSLVANNAITLAAASTLIIDDNGTYIHNNTGTPSTTIFAGTENFGANSNVVINNWVNNTTPLTTAVTLPFGNLEINWNAGGSWSQSLTGTVDLTDGNFIITSLGSTANEFRLTPATNGTALTLGIGGNLSVSAGAISFVGGGSNGSKACTVNVTGDVSITGAVDMNSGNACSGAITFNINGNLSVTGSGSLQNSLGNGTRTVNFNNATDVQTFSSTATGINNGSITFNAGIASTTNTLKLLSNFVMDNAASLNILSGTTLDCGTNIVQPTVANSQGNFNLNAGATILVGSTGGISATGATGNIQTGTTRVFSAAADYIYNGSAAQVSGTGFTAANNLEINNASGVTLSVNAAVSNILTLTAGNINCGTNTLSVTNNDPAAIVQTSGYVIGYLQRAIATGANVYDYPVGTATAYAPATLDFSSVTGAGSITVRTTDGTGGNYPAPLNATKKLKRDWTITNSAVTGFTATASFTFLPGDLVGAATNADLRAYRVDPGPAVTYTSDIDYDITGNTFTYNNLSSFSSTAGFTEFGAGACNAGFSSSFTKTMASACGGGADGTITVTAAGGTTPYTYNWSGPGGYTAATPAITGLGAGDYTVVISEVTGCSVTIPDITIWQAFPPSLTNEGGNPSTCGNTGFITLYGSYGVPPFTYSIDGITYAASNTFTGLSAGTYTGYVKDLMGCIGTKPGITLTATAPIVVTAYTRPATSCGNNGTIELYRTGGIPPYTYSVDNVTYYSSNTFSSLAGGTYTGWVKDATGCKGSLAGIVVTKASAVSVTATKANTSACANNGYINLIAGGGVPGYTYSITGAAGPYQASSLFTGLAAGTYNGWVQDSQGCKNVLFSIVIGTDAASAITVTATSITSGSCNSSGSVQLFRTGGAGPFTYSLDNITYQSSNTFTGIAAGTYTGWVKDSKGCKGSRTGIVVAAASAVTVTESHTAASSCTNDGTIQLRPAGGVAPYTYSLDNIIYQSSVSFTGLAAGNYTGWAKDSKGCKSSVNITVSLNPISVTAYAGNASSCAASDGSIQLFVTGGFGPYTYSLDGLTYQSSNKFTGLVPNLYDGFIKDSRGCIGVLLNINVGPSCPAPFANFGNAIIKTATDNNIKNVANSELKIIAYPNPSSAAFTLILTGSNNDKAVIIVTDITGRKVLQSETGRKNSLTFGNDLKPGIYIVQVMQGSQKQSIRIIKE